MMQKTLLSSVYRCELTSIIGTITVANIVGVMMASRENWGSVANYLERILRLKKRELRCASLENTGTRVRGYTKQGPGWKE